MHRIKIFFIVFLLSAAAFGQSVPLSDKATVSVLTCGIGPEMYSLFGHTAIRIKDPENNLDMVYNYGAFDFNTPNFVLKFTKGDMKYFVTSDTFNDFIYQYDFEKRSVSEQVLDIPQEKKQQLFETLNTVLFSEQRFYTYKFIDRNCTNMAVDVINKVLGGKIIYKQKNTDVTYRETLFPYFNGHFYEQLGTSILFGRKVDRKATLLFLPIELQESIAVARYNNHPLAEKSRTLMKFGKEESGSWWNNMYTLMLLLILVVVANRKAITLSYLSFIAVLGLFFSIAGWYSLHEELSANYNVLLFNPILLVLVFAALRKKQKLVYGTSIFCLLSILVYLIVMLNKVHLWIVMPIIMANAILIGRLMLKSRNEMKS